MLSAVQLPRNTSAVQLRPKVLLADNHPQVLKVTARLLASDCDVVGTAADGRQALALSSRLDPDVVVLDIGMSDFDGFQTLRELRRTGSRAKVIMLTMHETDEYIAAAMDGGAQGYVVKGNMYSDLIHAIDHACSGRIFVPSLPSLASVECAHTVLFHANNDRLLDEGCRLAADRLESGELVVILGTPEMRGGIGQRLKRRGIDLDFIVARGQYAELDCAEAVEALIRERQLDKDCVARFVADLNERRVSVLGRDSKLTLIGELSGTLCGDGNFDAAVEMEQTWSRLTRDLPFFTVCCYCADWFQEPRHSSAFSKLCAEHGAVAHASA